MAEKNFYDLEILKNIPILEVAQMLGIETIQQGRSVIGKIRSEKTASCKFYTGTNTFYDFGAGEGGDTIKLVACCLGVTNELAIERLAELFGIQPLSRAGKREQDIRHVDITNSEYALIGIDGTLATKNFDMDVERYGEDRTRQFSEKYHMTVNELKEQYPKVYENMIKFRAIPYMYQQRQDYYTGLWNEDCLHRALGMDLKQDIEAVRGYQRQADKLNAADSILRRVVLSTALKYTSVKLNAISDIDGIRSGAISFEVGNIPYFDLKKSEAAQGRKLSFLEVPVKEFVSKRDKITCKVAAFVKGGMVNIACTQADREAIHKLFFGGSRTQDKGVQLEPRKGR